MEKETNWEIYRANISQLEQIKFLEQETNLIEVSIARELDNQLIYLKKLRGTLDNIINTSNDITRSLIS